MDDCNKISELLPLYFDGCLTAEETAAVDEHVKECEACRALLDELKAVSTSLRDMPEVDLPSGFHGGWLEKLDKQANRAFSPRAFVYAAASVAALFLLMSGIGSMLSNAGGNAYTGQDIVREAGEAGEAGYADTGAVVEDIAPLYGKELEAPPQMARSTIAVTEEADFSLADAALGTFEAEGLTDDGTNDGLVVFGAALDGEAAAFTSASGEDDFERTFSISLMTDDFAGTISRLEGLGDVLNSDVINPADYGAGKFDIGRASINLRVNADDYEQTKRMLRGVAEVTSENEYLEKYTNEKQDLRARVKVKTDETERLNALLEKSESIDIAESMNIMTMIEWRLQTAMEELDGLNGQLRYYDGITSSPYVYIEVTERYKTPPPVPAQTLGARMEDSFVDAWNGLVSFMESVIVFLAAAIVPIVIVLAVVAVIIVCVARSVKKRRRGNENE